MGRTLNFKIEKKESKFSEKELTAMLDVSKKFNSGKFENIWSCESFYLDPFAYFPNWYGAYQNVGQEKAWKDLNKRKNDLEKQGMNHFKAVKKLREDGFVLLHREEPEHEVHTFCKVQGNELNALLVLQASIEISKLIPKAVISLKDEGEFLLCPLKIKNGKAIPVVSDLIEHIEHYAMKMLFSKGFKGNILKELDYKADDFRHEFRMDINIENSYGDMTEYINEKLRNLKAIETALINSGGIAQSNEMYFGNLEGRDEKKWFDPYIFTRVKQVNAEDFSAYKMSVATLMDGFSGEAFGLSKKDAEAESYKAIGRMQKLLGLDKNNEIKMEVLGAEK